MVKNIQVDQENISSSRSTSLSLSPPKKCSNAFKRKMDHVYSTNYEFLDCSHNKINKPEPEQHYDNKVLLEKQGINFINRQESSGLQEEMYTYKYSTMKSKNNSCLKSNRGLQRRQTTELNFFTDITSNQNMSRSLEQDSESNQVNASVIENAVSQYPRQSVTFKEQAVFPCPTPGCVGWREASLRYGTPGDKNCQLFCRPAIGISETYEIFLPDDCSLSSQTDDNSVCNMLSCQCPLVVSPNGRRMSVEEKSRMNTSCRTHHQSQPDKSDDSCNEIETTTKGTVYSFSPPQQKSKETIQDRLPIRTSTSAKVTLHTNSSNNGMDVSNTSLSGDRGLLDVLAVVNVEGDGRCLFRSICVCVAPLLQTARRVRCGKPVRQKYAETETRSADNLRQLMVEFMKRQEVYQAMDTHVLNADQPASRFPTFAARLSAMSKPGTYAGEMEINAVADVIRRPVLVLDQQLRYINVYGAEKHRDCPACVLRYSRLASDVGHYDAVILKNDITGDDLCSHK